MKNLLITINKELGDNILEDRILDQVFDTYWPSFEQNYNNIIQSEPEIDTDTPSRSKDDILEEILYTTRTMDKRIRSLERNSDRYNYKNNRSIKPQHEAEHIIEQLVDIGIDPDDIRNGLKGRAPASFIMEHATKYREKKNLMDRESNENA